MTDKIDYQNDVEDSLIELKINKEDSKWVKKLIIEHEEKWADEILTTDDDVRFFHNIIKGIKQQATRETTERIIKLIENHPKECSGKIYENKLCDCIIHTEICDDLIKKLKETDVSNSSSQVQKIKEGVE